LKTVASEMAKYNLDLVAVQEVRWVEGGSQPADEYALFYGNGKANRHLGAGFFVHKEITSAVKRVEFINDRMLYITPKGRWCDIIVLNMHAPAEDKSDDTKDSLYEGLKRVLDQFQKYHMELC